MSQISDDEIIRRLDAVFGLSFRKMEDEDGDTIFRASLADKKINTASGGFMERNLFERIGRSKVVTDKRFYVLPSAITLMREGDGYALDITRFGLLREKEYFPLETPKEGDVKTLLEQMELQKDAVREVLAQAFSPGWDAEVPPATKPAKRGFFR